MAPSERSPRTPSGSELRRRAQGAKTGALQKALGQLDPELAEWADSFIFGQVWTRDGLEFEERMLVAITALAATEHPAQLKNYLFGAIEAGIPARKLHEALVMLVVYAGFPAALGSLTCWREVVESLRRRGIDLEGVP
jgi:4-carboxymuconolactone decarboxylase